MTRFLWKLIVLQTIFTATSTATITFSSTTVSVTKLFSGECFNFKLENKNETEHFCNTHYHKK